MNIGNFVTVSHPIHLNLGHGSVLEYRPKSILGKIIAEGSFHGMVTFDVEWYHHGLSGCRYIATHVKNTLQLCAIMDCNWGGGKHCDGWEKCPITTHYWNNRG